MPKILYFTNVFCLIFDSYVSNYFRYASKLTSRLFFRFYDAGKASSCEEEMEI